MDSVPSSLFGAPPFQWANVGNPYLEFPEMEDTHLPDVQPEAQYGDMHLAVVRPEPQYGDMHLPVVQPEPQYGDGYDGGSVHQYDNDYEPGYGDDVEFDSGASSTHHSRSSIPEKIYEFRPRPQDVVCFRSTWLDNDESGTYDPNQERNDAKRPLTKKKRYIVIHNRDALPTPGEPKKPKDCSLLAARQAGVSFVISLQLKSDAGRALLGRGTDNWPGYLNVLECDDPLGIIAHDSDGEATFIPQTRILRSHLGKDASNGHRLGKDSNDAPEEDLTGHPANRGCKGCKEWGLICPLREDAEAYPCTFCVEAETDCELCQPPKNKRSCEDCKKRKLRCSYLDCDDHGLPYKNCSEQGYRCVAGPQKGSIRPRISLDKPPSPHPSGCDECRKKKLWCSLSLGDSGTRPCTRCEDSGLDCTANRAERRRKPKNSRRKRDVLNSNEDKETSPVGVSLAVQPSGDPLPIDMDITPANISPDAPNFTSTHDYGDLFVDMDITHPLTYDAPNFTGTYESGDPLIDLTMEGITPEVTHGYTYPVNETIIQTALSHPIKYNHSPDKYNREPCHFCQRTRYGILGLGIKQVRVRVGHDGSIIEEIAGGHTESGHARTRICRACCLARIEIVLCEEHQLERIQVHEGMVTDLEIALKKLKSSKNVEENWCSLCPRLAQFRCCASQHGTGLSARNGGAVVDGGSVGGGETDGGKESGGLKGCGLLLCLTCALRLDAAGNELDLMIKMLEGEGRTTEYPMGLRADVGFLRRDGGLMRFYLGSR